MLACLARVETCRRCRMITLASRSPAVSLHNIERRRRSPVQKDCFVLPKLEPLRNITVIVNIIPLFASWHPRSTHLCAAHVCRYGYLGSRREAIHIMTVTFSSSHLHLRLCGLARRQDPRPTTVGSVSQACSTYIHRSS